MPTFPAGHSTTAAVPIRFEDVTQDGRVHVIAIPPALGPLWRDVLVAHTGSRNALKAGILPLLTRFTLVSTDQQVRVDRQGETHAGFLIARDPKTERVYMNVWAELRGAAGKLSRHVEPGAPALAGTLFAEHTFTKLFAPPDQRKVTRLDVEGYPAIPEVVYDAPRAETAQEMPPGARWLDELAPDSAEYAFTLDHTDSNQHVNSLVYIRLFLEAVHRRHGGGSTRTRAIDIAYRKPSFAGDRVRAQLRMFELDGAQGAAGLIAGSDGKPRCYVRALLGP